MSDQEQAGESFEEFKNSFAYGSRTDLNFKFLRGSSDADAAGFFQELLWKIGDCFADGQWQRLVAHVIEAQSKAYGKPGKVEYQDDPFVAAPKQPSEAKLALITSTGHFVEDDDPEPLGVKDMTQEQAIGRIGDFLKAGPTLSAIPLDTPREKIRVRHGGYDVRGAQADHNVALPLEPLKELQQKKTIGELAPNAYSFVGACAQTPLLKRNGPELASMLKQQAVDIALLVPV